MNGQRSTVDITSGLQLGRAEVLRGLRNFLDKDRPENHSTDLLKEAAYIPPSEIGNDLCSTRQNGAVSRVTLGRLPRDGAERVRAFPSATMPS